jgi:acetylornithine deacetylase/succinyl-diaminopimelate desuccinylase-like protein
VVREAARQVYPVEPVVSPTMAGTGPLYPFADTLGLPTADCGVGYPESRIHAPDENIRLADFVLGAQHVAAILERFAGS